MKGSAVCMSSLVVFVVSFEVVTSLPRATMKAVHTSNAARPSFRD